MAGTAATPKSAANPLKDRAALLVAVLAIVIYAIALVFLFGKADDADNGQAWERWVFLLSGIEAIVFAGAGWLFGREVNRGAAEQAKEATQTAQVKTAEAEKAKSKTDSIVAALESAGGADRAAASRATVGPGTGEDSTMMRAAHMARSIRDA